MRKQKLEKKYRQKLAKKYRSTGLFGNEQAQTYGEALEQINADYGRVTTNIVVSEAKKKSSPLHDYFDWDNNVASKRWREQQARNLVNHIVEVVIIEGKQTEQRSWFNVVEDGENIYVPLHDAVAVPDYNQQLLSRLISTLKNATVLLQMFKQGRKK